MRPGSGLAVFLALGAVLSQGQELFVDTLMAVQPWGEHATYTFPEIRMPGHSTVAERINRRLCMDVLDLDPSTFEGELLSGLWGEEGDNGMARVNYFEWSCSRPYQNILAIEMSGEFCGAYCDGFAMYHVYELVNGTKLEYDSLFTDDGTIAIADILRISWQDVIEKQIEGLEREREVGTNDSEETDRIEETLALYQGCLEARSGTDLYVGDLFPTQTGLIFDIASCGTHVDRALDEVGTVRIEIPFDPLKDHLKPEYLPLFNL